MKCTEDDFNIVMAMVEALMKHNLMLFMILLRKVVMHDFEEALKSIPSDGFTCKKMMNSLVKMACRTPLLSLRKNTSINSNKSTIGK